MPTIIYTRYDREFVRWTTTRQISHKYSSFDYTLDPQVVEINDYKNRTTYLLRTGIDNCHLLYYDIGEALEALIHLKNGKDFEWLRKSSK